MCSQLKKAWITSNIVDLLSEENAQLSFETPMGFHFHQAYWHVGKTQKLVCRDRKTKVPTWGNLYIVHHRQYINKVHAKNARQAVSPNMVHALDPTLLMTLFLIVRTETWRTFWSSMTAATQQMLRNYTKGM